MTRSSWCAGRPSRATVGSIFGSRNLAPPHLLSMTLTMAADPAVKGFAGDPDDMVGPFQETGKTVRQLLIALLRHSRGGM